MTGWIKDPPYLDAANLEWQNLINNLKAGVEGGGATGTINVKAAPYNAKGDGVTDDTAAIQAAVTAAGPPGEVGAVYFPPGTYLVSKVITIPAISHLYGASQWTTVIKTTSTTEYIFRMEESEIEIDHLRFQAQNVQTAGGAIDGRNFLQYGNLHDLTFGSNFKIGIDFRTALGGGATNIDRIIFAEPGSGVKKVGRGIVIGDGIHLAVGFWLTKIYMLAATKADMEVGIDLNYNDTCDFTDVLIQTCKVGIRTGVLEGSKLSTGCKFTSVVVDTAENEGWSIREARDMEMANCNAQGCGTGVVFFTGKDIRWRGGCIQNNAGLGIEWTNTTENVLVEGAQIVGNCNTVPTEGLSPVTVTAGAKDWKCNNCVVSNGVPEGYGGKAKKGIFVEKGAGERYFLLGNRIVLDAALIATKGIVDEAEKTEVERKAVKANNLEA